MGKIADLTESELRLIQDAVNERYGKDVELQLADSELRLSLSSRELTVCPTVFWQERGASFVIFKTGPSRYRCQFFYSVREQFGTGKEEYDDLSDCVVSLLQTQADEQSRRETVSEASGNA